MRSLEQELVHALVTGDMVRAIDLMRDVADAEYLRTISCGPQHFDDAWCRAVESAQLIAALRGAMP